MIRIAICDDDIQYVEEHLTPLINQVIKKKDLQAQITNFDNGSVLLEKFQERNIYDIVILDIDMPAINGKELARKLRAIDDNFTLAFFTAYEKEVFSAIPIGISAFIPKKFNNDTISSALTELFDAFLAKKPQYEMLDVLIEGKPSLIRIQAGNIYCFLLEKKIITAHTYSESYILSERKFDNIVKKFLKSGFYQISRTCIVNVDKIYEVLDDNIIMDNGDILMVSRRAKKGLLNKITMFSTIMVVQ